MHTALAGRVHPTQFIGFTMRTALHRRKGEHTAVTALLDTEVALRQGVPVLLQGCGIVAGCSGDCHKDGPRRWLMAQNYCI